MSNDSNEPYPIADPDELMRVATRIHQSMQGTDDAPVHALSALNEYPPLYAAAVGILVAKCSSEKEGRDESEWMAKWMLAVAQNRVGSVFSRGSGERSPEWLRR